MGSCRETNSIIKRYKIGGKKYVFELFKRRKLKYIIRNREFWEDNFMPIYCYIFGHTKYQPDKINEPNEWACKKCHRFIRIN